MFVDNSLKGVRGYFVDKLNHLFAPREIAYFFEWTCKVRFGLEKSDLLLNKRKFSESELLVFIRIVKRLLAHEPIQYILEKSYFMDLELKVGPGVLCPRPETEELTDLIIQENQSGKLLDIGTGSGAIPLAIKMRRPQMQVSGLDNSLIALEYAEYNSHQLGLDAHWMKMDILSEFPHQEFDVVVSNPPYIPQTEQQEMETNVLNYEPWEALFVPDEQALVFYERIADICNYILAPNGTLYFEIHESKGSQIARLLNNYKFVDVSIIKDLQGKDRMIKAKKAPPL